MTMANGNGGVMKDFGDIVAWKVTDVNSGRALAFWNHGTPKELRFF